MTGALKSLGNLGSFCQVITFNCINIIHTHQLSPMCSPRLRSALSDDRSAHPKHRRSEINNPLLEEQKTRMYDNAQRTTEPFARGLTHSQASTSIGAQLRTLSAAKA